MNNQENNKQEFTAKDILDNKQYRAILILIFYAIFFIGIIISARSTINKNKNKEANKEETKTEQKSNTKDKLKGFYTSKNANYEYKYTLIISDKTTEHTKIYEGRKYKDKDSYTLTEDGKIKTYISNDGYTFEKKGEQIIVSNETYYLINYFNPDVINKIITKSVYIDNNHYTIANRELGKLLNSNISMADTKTNTIDLYYTQDKITKIEIDYSNYANALDNKINSAKLTLEYKSFGTVEDFNIKN